MPQRETALVGKNNVRALVTGQEELLVKVNSYGPGATNVNIVNPLGLQTSSISVSVALASDQFDQQVTPFILVESGTTGTIGVNVWSISFASVGTANALISFDGASTFKSIAPGTTINMNAGIFNWYYQSGIFGWDTTTNPGASLIITYNA
jgi:hypothetical protein